MTATLLNEREKNRSAEACEHCGLPVPPALVDQHAGFQFCCGGCEIAYETIRSCGLNDYYALRGKTGAEPQPARVSDDAYTTYDADVFQARHVSVTDAGYRSIEFRLEGVHCAACVWLVERLPQIVRGVIASRLSLGSARTRIVWDPSRTRLSAIARQLDRLGYPPHPARDASARAAKSKAERGRLVRMATAGALAGNNMLIAVALYAGVFEGIDPAHARMFRWLSMAIGWLSLAWPGMTFFRGAWAAFRARTPNLDQPIALALAVGAVAGTVNVMLDRGEVYFDSLSTLVFLLLVGRFLQGRQQRWAEEAVGLTLSMTPDSCRVLRSGVLCEEPTESLQSEEVVEVWPGELMPADGEVTSGSSTMDQSLLTGESRPVPVATGDTVYAGSLNTISTLRVRVGAVGEATRIGKILRLVEEGLAEKPPIVQFADRVAGWFVATMAFAALANLAWWFATEGLSAGIDSTVALLIVACPCALGLATPLTMAVAIGNGSRRGMLIKSAAVLERLAAVDPSAMGRVLVDKTGTLTSGRFIVSRWIGDDRLLPWIAAVEHESPHPIANALVRAFGRPDGERLSRISDRQEHHGRGATATTPMGRMLVGSLGFASSQGVMVGGDFTEYMQQAQDECQSVVLVAIDGQAVGLLTLRDELYADSRSHVEWLQRHGWRAEVLSGDTKEPVRQVAASVGIASKAAHAQVTPEGKLEFTRQAIAEGGHPTVMMVGDGVNDAAALAAADVGVAVKGGAEASLAAADVYLLEAGIGKVVELVKLAHDTMRVARRNLAISLSYNLLAVSLAIGGVITPLAAAILMPISSLTVLGSAVVFATRCNEVQSPHLGR